MKPIHVSDFLLRNTSQEDHKNSTPTVTPTEFSASNVCPRTNTSSSVVDGTTLFKSGMSGPKKDLNESSRGLQSVLIVLTTKMELF